jgi:hypothetical protein
MQLSITQIAEAFSMGKFEITYPYLAEDIQWNIVGDKTLIGKVIVVEFCNKTAKYFSEVTTRFTTKNVIENGHKVAINGTAQFINSENKSTFVSSSDVYLFEKGKLLEITSHCIIMNTVG